MNTTNANHTFSDKEILRQLNKILKAEMFRSSKVLSNFLKFVVSEKLKGREDTLKEHRIAVKGLGLPATFDPKHLANIRIYAIRLRTLLQSYYTSKGANDEIRISVPKGGYKPAFSKHVPGSTEQPAETANQRLSIAVHPLMKGTPGISEELVHQLGEQLTSELTARSGLNAVVYPYAREGGQEGHGLLPAALSITGTLTDADDTLVANIQLLSAQQEAPLQSWQFETGSNNPQALVAEIATAVYRALDEQKETLPASHGNHE
ncbi:hypothetical protein [Deminuibacter soli]|uniref:Uncharacterized protein n=1 Tax=Deminuibacter soli TaxID=2291815 RepID=A0A3E1NFQ6_9BACT|nr:hypothetical protein [Deminuibacter soli]RFM26799.1 hypothetical protein DXN05_17570 [Deminuibacter soli]